MTWAVVTTRFDGRKITKVVALFVEVGDTVKIIEKSSEKWWLCTDGVDTGYLPPDCLLITQQREEEDEEEERDGEVDIVDLDIISILKSESEDDTSRSSRSTSTDKKVKFKSEHTVYLIKKDRTGNETGSLGEFTEPILPDDMGGGRKTLKAKKKVTFGFRKNKSYGYFINPLYKQSHDKMKKNEKRGQDCDKDVCYHWKTSSHKDCYNVDQFSKEHYEGSDAESESGFIASSLNFVNGLCGGGRGETDMRGFNLMTFIISRE